MDDMILIFGLCTLLFFSGCAGHHLGHEAMKHEYRSCLVSGATPELCAEILDLTDITRSKK